MFNFSRFAKFLANGEMPTETALDEAIAGYNENKKREDSAIEVIITYLEKEDTPIERNQFAKRWGLKKESAGGKKESEVTEDADVDKQDGVKPPTDLEKHDARFHPKGYKEGDACKYRETLAKSDNADDLKAAEKAEGGNLSNKKRDEYNRLMAKKHPELDPAVVLGEIAKIADPKLQHDAFVWTLKGAVKLPEDMYKVEQARELATKAKKDPLSWDSPQACINELMGEGHKISEKRITVDELKKNPLMSDYRDEGYGVETFEVEDSKEGQQLMREVINTHWGKDANPWCLLHGDGEGNLSDGSNGKYNAWHYWEHYNGLPKRVAFKDGKLLAFMATDKEVVTNPSDAPADIVREWTVYFDKYFENYLKENLDTYLELFNQEPDYTIQYNDKFDGWVKKNHPDWVRERYGNPEQWWDRQDESHDGIPLGYMPIEGDKLGRTGYFELSNGDKERIGDITKETKDGTLYWRSPQSPYIKKYHGADENGDKVYISYKPPSDNLKEPPKAIYIKGTAEIDKRKGGKMKMPYKFEDNKNSLFFADKFVRFYPQADETQEGIMVTDSKNTIYYDMDGTVDEDRSVFTPYTDAEGKEVGLVEHATYLKNVIDQIQDTALKAEEKARRAVAELEA